MKIFGMAFVMLVIAGLTSVSLAADTKKLLVGKWEATKADEGSLPVGSCVEFSADGKLTLTVKKNDKESTVKGGYSVEGDTFTYKMKFGDQEIEKKIMIKKISDSELITTNDENKTVEFKRLK